MTCKTMASKDGMTVEFHNMGKSEVPAGTKVHWRAGHIAQGDMDFASALAPGKTASQDYMMKASESMGQGSGGCMVQMSH
jgi:hypothetical protein